MHTTEKESADHSQSDRAPSSPSVTSVPGAAVARASGIGNAAFAQRVARMSPDGGHATTVLARRTSSQDVTDTREIGDAAATMADEENTSAEMTGSRAGTALGVTNIQDINQARSKVQEIQGFTTQIESAGENSEIPADALAVNQNAIAALNDYLIMAGEQGRELSGFQSTFQTLRGDYARLDAEMNHLRLTGAVGQHSGANAAGDQAADVVRSATGGDSAASRGRVGGMLERNAGMSSTHRDAQAAHNAMQTASAGISGAQNEARQAVSTFQEASNNILAGLPTRGDSEETQAAATQLNDARKDVEAIKGYISQALDALKAVPVVGAAVTAYDANPIVRATGATSTGAANFLVDRVYDDKITSIERRLNGARAIQEAANRLTQVSALRRAKSNFIQKMTAVNDKMAEYGRARQTFQQAMQQLGGQMDQAAGGGSGYAMISRLLTDTDVFVTQCDTALRMAHEEQTQAEDTRTAATKLTGLRATDATSPQGRRERTGEALPYYEPYRWFSIRRGVHMRADRKSMSMMQMPNETTHGTTEGQMGVNPIINRAVQEITGLREQGQQMRGVLSSSMGMNMSDAAPRRVGAPT